jgi:peroxiredoxin
VLGSAIAALGWLSAAASGAADVAGPAPEFTLTDSTGTARSLADFRGRVVVLEWFNYECPFVQKQYGSGTMQRLQATYTDRDVVWLTIVSSAPGKQGHLSPEQARAVIREQDSHQTALLLDPDGAVGRRYGAKTTPHLFIIGPEGLLRYTGAIDDRPSTDPADIPGATNYVQRALDEVLAGRTVSIPTTKPYGCSVKY